MSTRTPRLVWECRTEPSPARVSDGLDDLREAIRRYAAMPGARLMTGQQVEQARRLTPLERALEVRPASVRA